MCRVLSAVLLVLSAGALAPADERAALPPCAADRPVPPPPGRVVRLFELHKDHNPENVLVVHTYADARCRLVGGMKDKGVLVDMYWRMKDGSPDRCYKPAHPRIKSETLETLDVKALSADKKALTIDVAPLDGLAHDLPSREMRVSLVPTGSGCAAEARLALGAPGGAVLLVRELKAKGKYRLGVPTRGVSELELKGVDAAGKALSRVYRSKQ